MKRKKTMLSFFLVFALLGSSLFGLQGSAYTLKCTHGYYTYYDHILSGGVGNYGKYRRYYWIKTSSAEDKAMANAFTSNITNAFSKWVNTSPGYPNITTSISWRETKTKADAMIEFHGRNLGIETDGRTEFRKYDRLADETKENWGWVIIYVNPNSAGRLSEAGQTGMAAHEIGHAMGLTHQESSSMITQSVMYPFASRKMEDNKTQRQGPAKIDCQTINHLYG